MGKGKRIKAGKRGKENCWDCQVSFQKGDEVTLYKIWNAFPGMYSHLPIENDGGQMVYVCESCTIIRDKGSQEMKKENSESCHNALMDYQVKYGDEALTDNESQFLYGVINYEEFKRRVSAPQDEPFKTLGVDKHSFQNKVKHLLKL